MINAHEKQLAKARAEVARLEALDQPATRADLEAHEASLVEMRRNVRELYAVLDLWNVQHDDGMTRTESRTIGRLDTAVNTLLNRIDRLARVVGQLETSSLASAPVSVNDDGALS